jgi:hypothetical protein
VTRGYSCCSHDAPPYGEHFGIATSHEALPGVAVFYGHTSRIGLPSGTVSVLSVPCEPHRYVTENVFGTFFAGSYPPQSSGSATNVQEEGLGPFSQRSINLWTMDEGHHPAEYKFTVLRILLQHQPACAQVPRDAAQPFRRRLFLVGDSECRSKLSLG